MQTALRWGVLTAFAVALTGDTAVDEIKLSTFTGCVESRALVWGKFASGTASPASFQGGCEKIVLGTVEESLTANQAVVFSVGRPPAFERRMRWNNGTEHVMSYPNVYTIPVKVWVVTSASLNLTAFRTQMDAFLIWANDRLKQERTGLELVASPSAANWVVDATGDTRSSVTSLRDFKEMDDCSGTSLTQTRADLFQSGALNIYIVNRVAQVKRRGRVTWRKNWGSICVSGFRDMAFIASESIDPTYLHEIGHLFGLGHAQGKDYNNKNVMWQSSAVREFLTEGQVFRMNFTPNSALNVVFGQRTADQRDCPTGSVTATPDPCPEEKERLWTEN